MPIQEPGVIVRITGEPLLPPNPPTRFGYAGYVFAANGSFKTNPVLNSTFPKPFENIAAGPCSNDISFLRTTAPLYGQLIPNLGHKNAAALISFEDDPNDTILSQIAHTSGRVLDEYKPLFVLPFWLFGPPKLMSYYRLPNGTVTVNRGTSTIKLHEMHLTVTLNGYTFHYIPDLDVSGSLPPGSVNLIPDECLINIHGNIPTSGPFSIVLWLHSQNTTWPDGNVYIYLTQDNSDTHLYIYADISNQTLPWTPNNALQLNITNMATGNNILTYNANLPVNHIISFDSTVANSDFTNKIIRFNAIYFAPVNSSIEVKIDPASSGSINPYKLVVTEAGTDTEYELSYSPLDTGYYGFINERRMEIVQNGSIYDDVTGSPDVNVVFVARSDVSYFTSIPFYTSQHDLRIHYTRNVSWTFLPPYTGLPSPLPDEHNTTASDILKVSYSSNVYIYLKRHFTKESAGDLYDKWIDAWNNYVLYYDTDIRPIKESPLEADLLTDYGGDISYGFTKFIRGHNKFMFKVLGTGDLTRVRIRDIKNYTTYYWRLFDLGGFHFIRLQGNSTTGVTSSALFVRAVFDYRFRPIFGINASLSITDADFEFPKLDREDLLERNVNTIVKDRTLFLWYFNNNLTEENRRDDSPLGEECNARVAIRLTKLLGAYVERYIGQPNNVVTRSRITADLTNFINTFIANNPSGLQTFRVICDESNNTPADIQNNRLNIRVEARFSKSIKYIIIFERVLAAT